LTARDPKHWKDAEQFVPERFAEGNNDGGGTKEMDLEFFPFGAGRRNCPGKLFGSTVFVLTLANLLYHFNWELPCGMKPDELDMTETFSVNVKRKSPLMLHVVPHTSG
jgi:cytochrome P450